MPAVGFAAKAAQVLMGLAEDGANVWLLRPTKLRRKGVMCNPGDVCCARNMQFS